MAIPIATGLATQLPAFGLPKENTNKTGTQSAHAFANVLIKNRAPWLNCLDQRTKADEWAFGPGTFRAHTIFCFVARAGVVDGDPRGRIETGAQHVLRPVEKGGLALDQQPQQLTLRDDDAEVLQQREQARHGGLALMILGGHDALQLGAEVLGDPGRQLCHDGTAIGQLPALAPVQRGQRLDDQVLDQELLVALEARAAGHIRGLYVLRFVDRGP